MKEQESADPRLCQCAGEREVQTGGDCRCGRCGKPTNIALFSNPACLKDGKPCAPDGDGGCVACDDFRPSNPLLERLRAWYTPGDTITGDVRLYLDAADEIERLMAELAAMKTARLCDAKHWEEKVEAAHECISIAEAGLKVVERRRDELKAERDRLLALLQESRKNHYECEDCWYSCATLTCDEHRRGECDCGADKWNAKVDAALSGHLSASGTCGAVNGDG